ncbi:NAD(P)-binding protein [Stipitochalara longipes BDJ]|nr:NAD(P)-binding protein [Stipitochalara longipes BDJ]
MSPYAAAHAKPQGAGDARPTALQIIRDESLEGQLIGKIIVITGATSGIGLETARALSVTGATLILTARDTKKAEAAFIHSAASTILARSNNQVNILINNAGIMGIHDLKLTEDGHEIHFATNHLSHFLLFQLLKPALLSSSTPAFHSRVINVASSAHRTCHLNSSDNYNFEKGGYHFMPAYSNSKLANIYMANELERRYGHKGLHATSLHPGAIFTNLPRHLGPEFVDGIMGNESVVRVLKSTEQGAATTVVAAVGKEWEGNGGKYLEDCEEAKRGEDDGDGFGIGSVSQTYDSETEARLWRDSLEMVGMKDDME